MTPAISVFFAFGQAPIELAQDSETPIASSYAAIGLSASLRYDRSGFVQVCVGCPSDFRTLAMDLTVLAQSRHECRLWLSKNHLISGKWQVEVGIF